MLRCKGIRSKITFSGHLDGINLVYNYLYDIVGCHSGGLSGIGFVRTCIVVQVDSFRREMLSVGVHPPADGIADDILADVFPRDIFPI